MKNLKAPVQPRKSNKTPKQTFTVRLDSAQINYINGEGGSKYLRSLIIADMIKKAGGESNEPS
jgi:hypothetical protein